MEYTKEPTTYEQQIRLLEQRGIIVNDVGIALKLLSTLGYYGLTGYLYDFRDEKGNFPQGITIDNLNKIYNFDRSFRNVLSYIIEQIEITIKTQIAYILSHKLGKFCYLDIENFRRENELDFLKSKFESILISNEKIPYIKHHIDKYDGQFPLWVAIEIFTVGMLRNLYQNLKREHQKDISDAFDVSPVVFSSWLENINYVRNLVAHYMRIYNFRLQKVPVHYHKQLYQTVDSKKIFDVIIAMKWLYKDKNEWNNRIIANISELFDKYEGDIDIACLGFPNNWASILYRE